MQTFVTRSLALVVTILMVSTALATTIVKPVSVPLVESEYGGRNAVYSYNGAGLDFDLTTGQTAPVTYPGHSNDPNSRMWHSSVPVASTWIVYDLGANYLLSGAHIWNFNEVNLIDRDAKDITLSFSTTSPSTGYGTPFPYTLLQTAGANGYLGETKSLGEIVQARYVRVDILNHYTTPTNNYTGLSEIRLLSPEVGTLAATPANGSSLILYFDEPDQPTTFDDVFTLENTGGPDTVVAITGYTITGLDAAQFDLTSFAPTFLGSGESVEFELDFTPVLGQSAYNAQLTFLTNLGNVVYQLSVVQAAPEPSSLLLLGGIFAFVARRRRVAGK
jgi:hypothetical protein